jgi:hypothetical protein
MSCYTNLCMPVPPWLASTQQQQQQQERAEAPDAWQRCCEANPRFLASGDGVAARTPGVERAAPDLQLLAVPLLQARAAVMNGRQLCDDAVARGRWRHRSRRFYNKGETAAAHRCCDRRLVLLSSISGGAASSARRSC